MDVIFHIWHGIFHAQASTLISKQLYIFSAPNVFYAIRGQGVGYSFTPLMWHKIQNREFLLPFSISQNEQPQMTMKVGVSDIIMGVQGFITSIYQSLALLYIVGSSVWILFISLRNLQIDKNHISVRVRKRRRHNDRFMFNGACMKEYNITKEMVTVGLCTID
ncbi:hypothetical protein ACJX0J_039100 [Zea mays]